MTDLTTYSAEELLSLYAGVLKELNDRQIVRTYNSPVGDYAEWLVAEKLGLTLEKNANAGYDATDSDNVRYQIKSRWARGKALSQRRKLNVIRNLDKHEFDVLIAVIFDEDFSVKAAYSIPYEHVGRMAKYNEHQNGHIITLLGKVLEDEMVEDITERLR